MSPQAAVAPSLEEQTSSLHPADWSAIGTSEHFVQFYERDDFLIQSVAGFIDAGLRQGEAVIILATRPHTEAIWHRLREADLDIEEAQASGRFILPEAAE